MNATNERLSPEALRWLNDELEPSGFAVCRDHQGHPLPLTDEYFYRHGKNRARFQKICKACHKARMKRRFQERYAADPAFRARKRAQASAWKHRNPDWLHAYNRRRNPHRKAAHFARVLERRDA